MSHELPEQAPGEPGKMVVVRRSGTAVRRGRDGVATGPFWVETLLDSCREGENTVVRATFEPGVVTHWHAHPLGQVLYVLLGVGLVQRDGGPVEEVRAGECVRFAPDERHWHGATPESVFAYVSVQAAHQGTTVRWMEPVEAGGRRLRASRQERP